MAPSHGLAIMGDMTVASADRIVDIIARAGDKEAVGLLWRGPGEPEIVVELYNMSHQPESSYVVHVDSMVRAFADAYGGDKDELMALDWSHLTLWHSHPSGLVGPSRKDMQSKLPDLRYMVIAMTDDGPVVTEF